MKQKIIGSADGRRSGRAVASLLLIVSLLAGLTGPGPWPRAHAQDEGNPPLFDEGIDAAAWYADHEIEHAWRPDYLDLAIGDPDLATGHGVYAWPFALDSIGWNIQSYQHYGGTPYFHHGLDMLKADGTNVYNRSGGQVINVENYRPGNDLYWEVAVLDPDGYIWQYHHIDRYTIPQLIWDKFAEYQADPVNGGFVPADTYVGDIVYWPVMSFGKRFNHIHLNILAAGGVYVNGFAFHTALPDAVGPEIQAVGLLQDGMIYPGNEIEGEYGLYVHARDLVLDDVYYLPPYKVTFSVDGGPLHTTWQFDTLPGGGDLYAYLDDFYVSPTCGDYSCREFYIDLGFIPDAQFEFPGSSGQHTVQVHVHDYAGNAASLPYTYTVLGPPEGTPVWQDDFETDRGWLRDPEGTDTASRGLWERGDPQATYSDGPKQLGTTASGLNDLVTGRLAGSSAGSHDVDGGVTSIRSPDIALPPADRLTLSFRCYLAHGSNSSPADYFRVTVVGLTTTVVFEELGAADDDDGAWMLENVNVGAFAGQSVYLLVEASDAGSASLVEAAIDDVVLVATGLNQAPIADPQSVTTAEDTPLDILLTGSDPDGDPVTYSVVLSPSHGTLTGTAPSLSYSPAGNYHGTDAFAFVVHDGLVNSEPAEVQIDVTAVNDVPLAHPQSITTRRHTPVAIVLSGSDVEADPLTYSIVAQPEHGVLGGIGSNLVYTPAAGYIGADGLTFVVDDGALTSAPAVVDVRIVFAVYVPVVIKSVMTFWP